MNAIISLLSPLARYAPSVVLWVVILLIGVNVFWACRAMERYLLKDHTELRTRARVARPIVWTATFVIAMMALVAIDWWAGGMLPFFGHIAAAVLVPIVVMIPFVTWLESIDNKMHSLPKDGTENEDPGGILPRWL